ncbi:hypothetical protein TDB9533_03445 [Thalassocella blandensis]|nr:hypothetical protein TDB9533_03445 [Thalassocella blandensis]
MNILKVLFISLFSFFAIPALSQSDIAGQWVTIDDDGETKKSIVELTISNGELSGKIIKLLNPDPDKPKTCEECKGANKDKPIEGLVFLQGMTFEDGEWSGGKILDPASGKEYKCNMSLIDDGKRLKVRGFIGFSLIGRTQYWHKHPAE